MSREHNVEAAIGNGMKMEVKLIFTNVMYGYIDNQPEYEEMTAEIDSDTTIGQLFTVGDLSEYLSLIHI